MMPRYIDAEDFAKRLAMEVYMAEDEDFTQAFVKGMQLVKKAEDATPTADVVPRAEVSEMFHEIFEIIKKYEFDALTAKENYGVFQVRNFGCDIMKLQEKYNITDTALKK